MENIEIVDNAEQALLTQAIANLERYEVRKEHGEPLYANNPDGLEKFKNMTISYFEAVRSVNSALDQNDKPVVPSCEGWVCFMGFTRQALHKYKQRGEEWERFIEFVRENLAATKIQRLVTGKTAPIAGIFDLVNNFCYRNTSDVKHIDTSHIQSVSAVQYPTLAELKGDNNNEL